MSRPATDATYVLDEPRMRAPGPAPVLRSRHGSDDFNTLDTLSPTAVLEVDALCYHHNSAVTLPSLPSQPGGEASAAAHWEDSRAMRGVRHSNAGSFERFHSDIVPEAEPGESRLRRTLVLLAVVYKFLDRNPDYGLLLAGHTDTSGDEASNFALSELRAANALALLEGDVDSWVRTCGSRSKIEDQQVILQHYARVNGWDCDPGDVDNQLGPRTRQAVRSFQSSYNQKFNASIAVDGEVGPQTWQAIFHVYMRELATLLDVQPDQLPSSRQGLRFLDSRHKFIGCGERIPIESPGVDDRRSLANRRVEALFFRSDAPPDLSAHLEGGRIRSGSAGREASGVYGSGCPSPFILRPLWWDQRPPEENRNPRHEIATIEEELEHLYDEPDSAAYNTEHPTSPEPGEDPWDFLDHFAEHHPGFGGAREMERERPG